MQPPIGNDGKVLLNFEHEFDTTIGRCLTKIAFNYLAWVAGAGLALEPEFDRCREFVRYGTGNPSNLVYLKKNAILAQEILAGGQITDGHIVTVEANTLVHSSPGQCAGRQSPLGRDHRQKVPVKGCYDLFRKADRESRLAG